MEYYDSFSLRRFHEDLERNAISLAFHGSFSQDTIGLINISLQQNDNAKTLTKRIFSLVVEMGQNIHHYSAKKIYSNKYEREIGVGVLAISETESYYVITSGNFIDQKDGVEIGERFEEINDMNEDELKNLYKERRKMPQRPDKPGANLGFIDIRRKSGNRIDYEIREINHNNSFFILSAKINKSIN
ncbi:SiaB family protein kinase [Chondrinema litorale]|uniref:SiaB family protein kinase n=1 Tax=Chondrinema litorale TaxID=2994555 RepID=UPI002543EA2E|nr:SiaB family protein kinase [Chondrinema litorale]UZR95693.1 SiaB family protein kinase [Chondrinema litorale]